MIVKAKIGFDYVEIMASNRKTVPEVGKVILGYVGSRFTSRDRRLNRYRVLSVERTRFTNEEFFVLERL